jgi:hypothetical protein
MEEASIAEWPYLVLEWGFSAFALDRPGAKECVKFRTNGAFEH